MGPFKETKALFESYHKILLITNQIFQQPSIHCMVKTSLCVCVTNTRDKTNQDKSRQSHVYNTNGNSTNSGHSYR